MKIKANALCNVHTGEDTSNARATVEITIPRFRARLSLHEAEALSAQLAEAVAIAKQHDGQKVGGA